MFKIIFIFNTVLFSVSTPGKASGGHTCVDAQKIVEPVKLESDTRLSLNFMMYEDKDAFVRSKPSLEGNQVNIHGIEISEESTEHEQTWCKFKTSSFISSRIFGAEEMVPLECAAMHEVMLERTVSQLSEDDQARFFSSDLEIVFGSDQQFGRGDGWVKSAVEVEIGSDTVFVSSSSLSSPDWVPVIGGKRYCKFLSLRSIELLVERVLETNTKK